MLENTKLTGFADEIDTDLHKQIKLLNELSMKYIELRSVGGKNVADFTWEEAENIKEILEKHDIKVSAIGSPIGKIQITDEYESHFTTFKKVVELAKWFDAPYIRIFSFFIPDGENADQYQEEVFRRLERMIAYAKEQNVILLHENEKDIYGDSAERCLALFANLYGSHFKGTFDFANFVQCGQDTLEAYKMLEPYIEYIHIKDAILESGEVVLPGEGDGNLKEILGMVEEKGYSGFLSLEPHLVEFASLKTLEKDVKQRRFTDGEAAYRLAYQSLMKILVYNKNIK